MGKSEYRQFCHRLDILLMHLLKWQYQPEHRSSSWERFYRRTTFPALQIVKGEPQHEAQDTFHDTRCLYSSPN